MRPLSKSGESRRPCRPFGPWRGPSRDEGDRFLRRPARIPDQPQGTIGSRERQGRLFAFMAGRVRGIRFRDVRRRRALLLKCILVRWRASRDLVIGTWKASCRLCRADETLGAQYPLGKPLPCVRPARRRHAWSREIGWYGCRSKRSTLRVILCWDGRRRFGSWSDASVARSGGVAGWLQPTRTRMAGWPRRRRRRLRCGSESFLRPSQEWANSGRRGARTMASARREMPRLVGAKESQWFRRRGGSR